HDVGPHVHVPATHRWPVPHADSTHTLAHPSLSPHAFPTQLGVHAPAPHMFGVPPPPHVWPTLHPPQSTILPQRLLCWPHLPAHSGSQPASASPPAPAVRSSKPPTAEHAAPPRATRMNAATRFMARPSRRPIAAAAVLRWPRRSTSRRPRCTSPASDRPGRGRAC